MQLETALFPTLFLHILGIILKVWQTPFALERELEKLEDISNYQIGETLIKCVMKNFSALYKATKSFNYKSQLYIDLHRETYMKNFEETPIDSWYVSGRNMYEELASTEAHLGWHLNVAPEAIWLVLILCPNGSLEEKNTPSKTV